MSQVTLQAGGSRFFSVSAGQWLVIREAENYIDLLTNTQERVRLDAGDVIKIDDLTEVELVNPHAVEITFTMQVSRRQISVAASQITKISQSVAVSKIQDAITVAKIQQSVPTKMEGADTLTPLSEVSIVSGETKLLAVANASRKELRLGIKSSEANGVYIGNASVGVETPGGYIEEGCIEYLNTEGEVYGYNAGNSSIVVNVLELERQ